MGKPAFELDFDYVNELTSKLIQDLEIKKEEIITERLKQIGIEINYDEEKKRRFKSMVCEIHDNEQRWYYNDGSISGIRVVTFVDNPKNSSLDGFHIGINTDYY